MGGPTFINDKAKYYYQQMTTSSDLLTKTTNAYLPFNHQRLSLQIVN